MLERRAKRFDRQREHLVRHGEATTRGKCCVRHQCRRARRAVDQRSPLLHLKLKADGKRSKQRIERQDLAGATLPLRWHHRHQAAVEHRRNG
ncbi:hypothetical protein [Mesorhizobium sp. M0847]|uniref:hypothetical protein n=1 Tax=unclassified Mesorhizobium TaxID=325217 RepID=UPI003334F03B